MCPITSEVSITASPSGNTGNTLPGPSAGNMRPSSSMRNDTPLRKNASLRNKASKKTQDTRSADESNKIKSTLSSEEFFEAHRRKSCPRVLDLRSGQTVIRSAKFRTASSPPRAGPLLYKRRSQKSVGCRVRECQRTPNRASAGTTCATLLANTASARGAVVPSILASACVRAARPRRRRSSGMGVDWD